MKEEYVIGDWGWFWDDGVELRVFGPLFDIKDNHSHRFKCGIFYYYKYFEPVDTSKSFDYILKDEVNRFYK